MIVRNEANFLAGCLRSLLGADEVIVCDTGSTDATRQIAADHGARVVDHPWADHFGEARNAALAAATGDWVLIIDADERVAPGGWEALRTFIANDSVDVGFLAMVNASSAEAGIEDVLSGAARRGAPVLLPRLMRRTPDLRFEGRVHEGPHQWLWARRERIGVVPATLVHYGGVPTLRAALGRDQRNLRLLRLQAAEWPQDVATWAHLARQLLQAGVLDEAREAVARGLEAFEATQRSGAPLPAFGSLFATDATLALLERQPRRAIEANELALGLGLKHPDLLLLAAQAHAALACEGGAAEDRFLAWSQAEADASAALSLRGLATTEEVSEGAVGGAAYLVRATARLSLGQWRSAAADLARLAEDHDDAVELAGLRAEHALHTGAFDRAMAEAAGLPDTSPDAWVLRGCALLGLGALAEAQACGDEARARVGAGWIGPHRATWLPPLRAADTRDPAPIFIGSVGRSGSTLLRVRLGCHPRIACGPEARLVEAMASLRDHWWRGLGGALEAAGVDERLLDRSIRAFLVTFLDGLRGDKARVAEKTPYNLLHFGLLGRLFPRARFIHVVRDGRGVVESLLRQRWTDPWTGEGFPWCKDLDEAARYWDRLVRRGRAAAAAVPGRVIEVRYEALVREPEATLRSVVAFVGEPWDPAVLHAPAEDAVLSDHEPWAEAVREAVQPERAARWRERLSSDQIARIEAGCAGALAEIGYA